MRYLSRFVLLSLLVGPFAGCFTAGGFGIGWRIDHVHNSRQIQPGDLNVVPAGERLRLTYDGISQRGVLLSADSSAVEFQPYGREKTRIPLMAVQSSRHDGRRKSGRLVGALVGLGVDVTILAIVVNDMAFFPD